MEGVTNCILKSWGDICVALFSPNMPNTLSSILRTSGKKTKTTKKTLEKTKRLNPGTSQRRNRSPRRKKSANKQKHPILIICQITGLPRCVAPETWTRLE